jgi:hypothetical protein
MIQSNKQAADGVLPKFPVVAVSASSEMKALKTDVKSQDVTTETVAQNDKRSNTSGKPAVKTEYRIW